MVFSAILFADPASLLPKKIVAEEYPQENFLKLFIGNLPHDITDTEIEDIFSQYGEVINASLIKDQYSGRSKGFAFVEMATRGEGHRAMETLNKSTFRHRELVCKEAIAQKKGKRRR